MNITVSGRKRVGKIAKVFLLLLFKLREALVPMVTVTYKGHDYKFKCLTFHTFRRATTLLVKEAGTIEWFENNVQPGDVVLDIGANIGLYTIFSAGLVGDGGCVYAVEPHINNAAGLVENIIVNKLTGRVIPLTMALSDSPAFDSFYYDEWNAGSTNSQFGNTAEGAENEFTPSSRELKSATTVDVLIECGLMKPPQIIKIDVDGLEPKILEGMKKLLHSETRPRSIQVETSPDFHKEVVSFMESNQYELQSCHFTMAGKKQLSRGISEEDLPCNAIFTPLAG